MRICAHTHTFYQYRFWKRSINTPWIQNSPSQPGYAARFSHQKILLFALPIAASSILQQLFNSADTAVAGQFGNADALAAVGTNGEIVALIVGICVGIAVGANVLIAKFIGAGERHRISGAVHTAMAFSVVFGILFTILGQFTARPLLALIHTPEDIMTSATNYLKVYFLGVPFLSVYNFGSAILRSKGDSKDRLLP